MNWMRNSYWHCRDNGMSYSAQNGGGCAPGNAQWWFGPGIGGSASLSFNEAIHGEWSGNPDMFLRCAWTAPATQADPVFASQGLFTFLENKINSARILAGKPVTLSIQVRGGGGVPVIPIIWRSFPIQPELIWQGLPVSAGSTVTRVDFSMTMPGIPSGQSISPDNSYVGVGLAMPIAFGPTIDIGPSQFNEGGPAAFEEVHRSYERLLARQQ